MSHGWEEAVAAEVELKTLEEAPRMEDSIAAALDDLDLVIEPLDEATAGALQEGVRDLIEARLQGGEEAVKAGQSPRLDQTRPGL
jgi:hypothetical protein